MNPTLTLGRIAGIRIGINWSWLIVFALIVWTLGASVFPAQDPHLGSATYAAMAVAAAFLFFASLLLHELGHALHAKREGVAIDGITLWIRFYCLAHRAAAAWRPPPTRRRPLRGLAATARALASSERMGGEPIERAEEVSSGWTRD